MKSFLILIIALFAFSAAFRGTAVAKTQQPVNRMGLLPVLNLYQGESSDDMPVTPYRYDIPEPVYDRIIPPLVPTPVANPDDWLRGPMRYDLPEAIHR